MNRPLDPSCRSACSGAALALALHVLLLALALGQIVYLASRHRVRVDATSDQMWSLTESTRRIVAGLDRRLVIEAYLSPKEDLPAQLRDTRAVLENFLDELVQLGRGMVTVQRFNPNDDKAIQDKCTRVGIKPIDARSSSSSAFGVSRHWQGLRLLYDGGKQKVLEQLAPQSSLLAHAVLTPANKEVVTKQRRKIGYMEWPSAPGGQQAQGAGWDFVRTASDISKRYEFKNFKDAEGALVPEDIDTLVLFRPMDLSDRQKYVIDQFLMRGGTIALFADVADYGLAPQRQCLKVPMALDAKDSAVRWQEQLLHYGIDLPGQIVADMAPQAMQVQNPLAGGFEYMGVPVQMGLIRQVAYPYFFHAVDGDWAQVADRLATAGGRLDEEQASYFRKTLRPGIDSDEFLFTAFKKFKRGPGFYWPSLIRLRTNGVEPDLPTGVEGRVLLWSSPLVIVEDPPQNLNSLLGRDLQSQLLANQAFQQKLNDRLPSEPRRQVPLMLELKGSFPSFFAGKQRPLKASELAEQEARKQADSEGDAKDAEAGPDIGPPMPDKKAEPAAADAVAEAAQLEAAVRPGRILAVCDSDFVRDDLVRGNYRQQGGPMSLFGGSFFLMMLDWLSQDADLVELQSRLPSDRTVALIDPSLMGEDRRDTERRLRAARTWLVSANVALPGLLLLGLGLGVLVVRRSQKRRFLESIGN